MSRNRGGDRVAGTETILGFFVNLQSHVEQNTTLEVLKWHLGISGHTPYDFQTTFSTRAKESGQTSAQVADLLGHKDTRMVERIYARTRHHSVMNQLEIIEQING